MYVCKTTAEELHSFPHNALTANALYAADDNENPYCLRPNKASQGQEANLPRPTRQDYPVPEPRLVNTPCLSGVVYGRNWSPHTGTFNIQMVYAITTYKGEPRNV